ncbi:MAG: sigma-70 family RNA polymerase sigma factor [Chitinophagaceae bacterium]|nr:sigma-70 family RNA polymerase sigma factor [Chitinophagaceae bacterium]
MTDRAIIPVNNMVDHLFRHEAGKMVSVLSRLLGLVNLQTAQDIVQDTLLQAMNTWALSGLPDNPPAWLHKVAKNKAIDFLRREKRFKDITPKYASLLQSDFALASVGQKLFLENEIEDSQLAMMFTCCHEAIPEESQIALVLKALCGLSVNEIARAFLTKAETISKRIYRAKEKIRLEKIELELPDTSNLSSRLDAVLKCLYLLFSEGYNSSHPDQLIREDLCDEAIRLASIITSNRIYRRPRVYALLSLMHFQASRFDARLDSNQQIILLNAQDRSRWDRQLIKKGFDLLELAAEPFETSTYHFEAGIASIHAAAPSFEETDWKSIYHLYDLLFRYQPSPVVALNKAIASGYAIGREQALNELELINGLEKHHLYHATRGQFLFDLKQKDAARSCFEQARKFTDSAKEQQLLAVKIAQCSEENTEFRIQETE